MAAAKTDGGGTDTERVLDLASARAARAEARGERPVLDVGDVKFTLPLEIRYSHIDGFMRGELDGLRALVRDGAEEAGDDPDVALEAWNAQDWPVADLLAIVRWLGDVYPELAEMEQEGNAPTSPPPKQPPRSKRPGRR